MELENRLWAELEAAAEREAKRGAVRRGAATARAAIAVAHLPAAAGIALAAALLAILAVLGQQHSRPQWRVEQFRPVAGDLRSGTTGFGSLWTYDVSSGQILRVDPRAHRLVARIPLATDLAGVALVTGAGAVWAVPVQPSTHSPAPVHSDPVVLSRIDPRTNRITAGVTLRARGGATIRPIGAVARPGAIWVWGEAGADRLNPGQERITASLRQPGDLVRGFAATDRRVSLATQFGRLVTYDAHSAVRLAEVAIPPALLHSTVVDIGDAVVIDRQDGSIAAIDPADGRTRWAARVDNQPIDATFAGGRLWVLRSDPGARSDELLALDPASGRTLARIPLPTGKAGALAPGAAVPLVTTESGAVLMPEPPR